MKNSGTEFALLNAFRNWILYCIIFLSTESNQLRKAKTYIEVSDLAKLKSNNPTKMKKTLLVFLIFIYWSSSNAQQTAGNHLVIQTPINATGTTVNALLKLPNDYNTTPGSYPILVFLHGTGESGTTIANLSRIYNNAGSGGPSYFIAQNQWPDSIINPLNGQPTKFIVLSPQSSSYSLSGSQLNVVINYMLANYRVDANRIYLTGLSAGGHGIHDYTTRNGVNPLHKPAAIVPMSMASGTPQQSLINNTIADSVRVWGFGSETDIHGINTHLFVTGAYNGNGGILAGLGALGRFSGYIGGHCCWNNFYNPTYKEVINGVQVSIYQWLLQFTRSGNTNSNLPPVANAGLDQTIMLPVSNTTLNGTGNDPDGSIVSYLWTKISGPNNPNLVTPNSAVSNVTGLVQGNYVFRLTVIDNLGAVGFDEIQVSVSANQNPPGYKNIIKVGVGEYFTSYLTDENKIYSTQYINGANRFREFPTLSNVIDVDGAQYTNIVLLNDGSVRIIKKAGWGGDSVKTVPYDANGNLFTGNSKIYGWYQAYLTIKNDSVYYWGFDYLNLNGGNQISAPIKIVQPAGKRIKKIVVSALEMSKILTLLTTDGTIWQYTAGNPNPVQVNIPQPVLDVASIGRAGYIASTVNNLYAWGPYASYFGLTDGLNTPTSVLTMWTNAGMVLPIKELVGNWNTIHIIDANDNLFGMGDNMQGEVGNGRENSDWKNYMYNGINYPFAWSWLRGQLMVNTPVQIRGKVKNLCTSNSIAFYLFVQDINNNWYSWGRNKEYALGNGLSVNNDATFPNWGDVPAPRSVDPSTVSWVSPIPAFNPLAILKPVANAGIDANINTNSTTLYGDYSFQQSGSVVSYSWSLLNGPNNPVIVQPNSATTTVNGLISGIYKFRVTVTNNFGLTDFDDIQINVNTAPPPPNQAPSANAGADQSITLPTNTVTLNGSGTDPDGTIAGYQWTKLTGPATFTIATPTQAQTAINNLVQGVYSFELRVTDNQGATGRDTVQITVNAAANQAPSANAGADQSITLPTNTVTLNGSGTDPDGTIAGYQWTKLTGPATFTIATPTQAQTAINNLVQGVYSFELRVTDNQGATGRDTVQITVNAAANQAPSANAGPDQSITLPTNTVTLNGSGTDPDGTIAGYQWTKLTGPATFTIATPTQAQTAINNLVQGVYSFELRVTDNQGATGRDTVQITVNAAANQAPSANAGPDQSITLPTNTVTLNGSGTDPDGTIAGYQWTKLTGPATFTIATPTQAQTAINNLVQGVYSFELRVTDNQGATGRDTVQITVNAAANQAPSANAGADQSITLPTNTVTLNGSGTDPDGTITGYQWTKLTGPATFTIATPTQAQTAINNLVQGVYSFELRVTDNQGATGRDTVQITVNAAANQAPSANAGPDQSITLPTNTVTLNGSGTDPDGTIAGYQWTKLTGPATFTIATPTQAQTAINNLVQGVYSFELRVTDNQGATGRDTVQITVNAAPNQAPTANAGNNQTIILPNSSVTLVGSGTDPDGTITGYQWTKVAGPSQFTISSATQPQTLVYNLVLGVYLFELKVTDNQGAIGLDTVQITVNALPPPNQLPTANAGPNQSITLPVNTVTVTGSGTDPDGTITGYQWTKLTGPATFTIATPTQAQTAINNLVQGVYSFELRVTDNEGGVGRDTIEIIVDENNQLKTVAILYPNPAISDINIQFNTGASFQKVKIVVTNVLGMAVYEREISESQSLITHHININKFSTGTYFVTIKVGLNKFIKAQFVKQ